MRGKGVPEMSFFLFFFCYAWVSEWAQKLVPIFFMIFGLNLGFHFFGGLGFFWVSFGCHLGPLEDFLRSFCSQKPIKTQGFFRGFEHEGFWCFEAPDGSYVLILALFGFSDPKLGFKRSFNIF